MASGTDTVDRRSGFDRRAGIDRRGTEDRDRQLAGPVDRPASAVVDRRRVERRGSERRGIASRTGTTAASAASGDPQLVCPICQGRLEYEVTLSWVSAAYTVDTGYCPSCSRRFLRTRRTGWYDSFSWAPLCRVCREPVTSVRAHDNRGTTVYHCPMHPDAVWEYDAVTDEWAVRA